MTERARWRSILTLLAALVLALGVAACGDDDDEGDGGGETATKIESNPANNDIQLTVASKDFDEAFFLGEVYAQALQAAGYDVKKDLDLGSEQIALKALEQGEISAYPEYTSTALTSFFNTKPEDVPNDAQEALDSARADFDQRGLVAYPPAPYESANAVGLLKTKADQLGVTKVSDLEGKSQDLTLYGSPECRQRVDCLVGLNEGYGLRFKEFKPVDIELRYPVLDRGQADLSILFTSDGELAASDKYTILEDDKGIFPAGNPFFVASKEASDQAGPDFGETIEAVQQGLTLEVVQEALNRITLDKEQPAAVATDYLRDGGYID